MELSLPEKVSIINEHLKSVANNIYNINMLIIQESAVALINQEVVDALNVQLENAFLKKQALEAELERVNNESGE